MLTLTITSEVLVYTCGYRRCLAENERERKIMARGETALYINRY